MWPAAACEQGDLTCFSQIGKEASYFLAMSLYYTGVLAIALAI